MDFFFRDEWWNVALQVVGAASAIAAVTPTPKDNQILFVAKKLIDCFAFNFGHAANKR